MLNEGLGRFDEERREEGRGGSNRGRIEVGSFSGEMQTILSEEEMRG